ncbi:MAG: antitoxin [Gemmatimonadaceae bacterium]
MRTTVDIEDPLLKRLRAEAKRRGVSFKAFLSGIIRRALDEGGPGAARTATRYRSPAYSMGAPTGHIDLDKALKAAALLEDEETARELSLRK